MLIPYIRIHFHQYLRMIYEWHLSSSTQQMHSIRSMFVVCMNTFPKFRKLTDDTHHHALQVGLNEFSLIIMIIIEFHFTPHAESVKCMTLRYPMCLRLCVRQESVEKKPTFNHKSLFNTQWDDYFLFFYFQIINMIKSSGESTSFQTACISLTLHGEGQKSATHSFVVSLLDSIVPETHICFDFEFGTVNLLLDEQNVSK